MSDRTGKSPVPPSRGILRTLFPAGIACAAVSVALAGGGPENALVIVNADSWASTYIANEYVTARHIPPTNVLRLRNLPDFERMKVEDFRTKILAPALHTAEQRGIAGQIEYVLYSADFPWAIDVTSDLAGQKMPQVITQPAAINGLTCLYQFTMGKNTGYLGMNVNFYSRQPVHSSPDITWSDADKKDYAEAVSELRSKAPAPAEKADPNIPPPPKLSSATTSSESDLSAILGRLLALRKSHPANTELLYNIACVYARLGNPIAAVGSLREAVDNGWWDMQMAASDRDLASIRSREDFAILAARARAVKFELTPTSGFRANVAWDQTGRGVPPDKGFRYLLSTVLACTSGRGNSVGEALASLHRSIGADSSRPKGTIYFMRTADVRSTTREWGFVRAAEKLREIGVSSEVLDGVLPKNKGDVAGVTIGSADFSWAASGSKLLPGAIGDNLTSFGGAMAEGDSQTPVSEFIRHGAAGASGTVTEPYAVQAKFPTPFIHWHYAQGCSLAEAYYQSLAGPYQLLIVGDALCAPWKKNLTVVPGDLLSGAFLKGTVRISPTARSTDGIKPAIFELYLDGRRIAASPPGKPIELDTTGIADGPHELAIAATGADPVLTRASVRVPVTVRNGESEFRITAPPVSITWDKPLAITAKAPGARNIIFFQNLDEVGRIESESGTATIDPRILGQGPVRIQPVAVFSDTRQMLGEPVVVRIKPPPAIIPPSSNSRNVYAEGFTVTRADGKKTVVTKAADHWLEKAGVGSGDSFTLEAWFTVAAADVYQFQLRGAADLRISVDSRPQTWPHGSEWWFVPVHLAPGRHSVRLEGKATTERLDVRFGGPGSRRLDASFCQHPNVN